MPLTPDDTTRCSSRQASPLLDDWNQDRVPRLPRDLEAQAKALHACQRSRHIRCASDLLRGLLAYVYTVHSFEHLSIWSVLIGGAEMSANAWRKRLQKASAWGQWLLQDLLSTSSALAPWVVRGGWRRIVLIDGTHLACRGPQGMVWRVHTAFDLLAGRICQLQVTDTHEAEHLELFDIQAGDLVVTDRANSCRERVVFVLKRLADLVVRLNPKAMPLEDEGGKTIEVVRWLKGQHAPSGRVCQRQVWIRDAGQRYPLRCIGLRLTREQQERAQRRKKRLASKQQRRLQEDTLYLAGWLLVITTLPAEQWSDQQVLSLYRARWQIELLFKRIKQMLNLHRLRGTTAATAQATLLFLLIGWALMEDESEAIRVAMREAMQCTQQVQEAPSWPSQTEQWAGGRQAGPLSEWRLADVCVDLLRQQIRGHFTAQRFRACVPRLQRFLCSGHRKRLQGYQQMCDWLGIPAAQGEQMPC
jgi:Transposase DDE domain